MRALNANEWSCRSGVASGRDPNEGCQGLGFLLVDDA